MKEGGSVPASRRRPGRPLSFDKDAALERAMLTFWQHGYETTSIVDLTTAMGVTAPSLYAAFGDKKRLFLAAVRLYAGDADATARAIASAPTALEAARAVLVGSAQAFTGDDTPPGCLLASATASGSAAAADVRRAVAAVRASVATALCARIERDVAAGALPADTDAAALAGLVVSVVGGLSMQARDGASRATLLAIAAAALGAWPQAEGVGRETQRLRP